MWGDESEGVAPIIWLYQTVDAQKEEVFFTDLLITLWRHAKMMHKAWSRIEEVPYCLSMSYVKLQGHTAKKFFDFDPN